MGRWGEGEIITSYQLPITSYQLPITNYQCPMPNAPSGSAVAHGGDPQDRAASPIPYLSKDSF
ncbi:MAG: hypothetical protein WBF90_12420 [Rivularia sp. (in: cyanobacteria)]|jgi:hypothetical protein